MVIATSPPCTSTIEPDDLGRGEAGDVDRDATPELVPHHLVEVQRSPLGLGPRRHAGRAPAGRRPADHDADED